MIDNKTKKIIRALYDIQLPIRIMDISKLTNIPESTVRYRLNRDIVVEPIINFNKIGYVKTFSLISSKNYLKNYVERYELNDNKSFLISVKPKRRLNKKDSVLYDLKFYNDDVQVIEGKTCLILDGVCKEIIKQIYRNPFTSFTDISLNINSNMQKVKYHNDNHLKKMGVYCGTYAYPLSYEKNTVLLILEGFQKALLRGLYEQNKILRAYLGQKGNRNITIAFLSIDSIEDYKTLLQSLNKNKLNYKSYLVLGREKRDLELF